MEGRVLKNQLPVLVRDAEVALVHVVQRQLGNEIFVAYLLSRSFSSGTKWSWQLHDNG
jgi:hypothetical protein